MASYAKLFHADGTEISPVGTFTDAVTFVLRLDENEVGTPQKLYAQSDTGYEVHDSILSIEVIDETGTTEKWALALDDGDSPDTWEDYGDPIELGIVGDDSGSRIYFWIRAKTLDTEEVSNDRTVKLVLTGIAGAADR